MAKILIVEDNIDPKRNRKSSQSFTGNDWGILYDEWQYQSSGI